MFLPFQDDGEAFWWLLLKLSESSGPSSFSLALTMDMTPLTKHELVFLGEVLNSFAKCGAQQSQGHVFLPCGGKVALEFRTHIDIKLDEVTSCESGLLSESLHICIMRLLDC